MSEEQIKIWKKVEAKGLEKLGNIEKALLAKEGFKEAHKDYHHIEEIVEAWHRRLDRDNVIGLSEANHRRIHKEYDRGYMAKKKMQRTLYDMLQRFRREFGDSGGI